MNWLSFLNNIRQKVNWLLSSKAADNPRLFTVWAGVLMAAAYPPLPLVPLLFLGWLMILSVLEVHVIRYDKRGLKSYWRLFKVLYPGLLVWNLGVTYWLLLTALHVPPGGETFEALLAGTLAITLNAVLMTLPLMLYVFIRKRTTLGWALMGFVGVWLTFEYLHLRWELTWSWLNLAHAFTYFPGYIQYIEWTGEQGIAFHLLVTVGVVFWVYRQKQFRYLKRVGIFLLIWIALPLVLGVILTRNGRQTLEPTTSLRVRVIQPNIDPYKKFDEAGANAQRQLLLRLITQKPLTGIDFVLLPETAMPGVIDEATFAIEPALLEMGAYCNAYKTNFLIGMTSYKLFYEGSAEVPPFDAIPLNDGRFIQYYNSALHLGKPYPKFYHKGKLVPFVERTPFLEQLSILKGLNIDIGGGYGSLGLPDSLVTFRLDNGVSYAPMICYESQFSEQVRQQVLRGAQFGAIITNDGWYGNTSGHIQHAYFAVLRAIEFRRPMVRSANTGISLTVDVRGQVANATRYWTEAVFDETIQLCSYQTFYAQTGDWLSVMLLLITVILFGFVGIRTLIRK